MSKLVKIFDQYYNIDNVDVVAPRFNGDKKEYGCTIWHNCSMNNEVFHTDVYFGKNEDGSFKHTTAEVVEHLNKGENLED